ncbi:MAG: peptidase domain-containing ABC transporter [Spirochaetaceae bacterium]|nr:peptidase domain-containing ABC transporter [Spirochaetaceae bacterium]
MISKEIYTKIIKIIEPYKVQLIVTFFATILVSFVSLLDSFLLSYAIDNVLVSHTKLTLITISVIMILVALLNISLIGIKSLLINRISYSMDMDLMEKFYIKVVQLPFSVLENHKSGELVSRLNDTRKVRNALSYGLISILSNLITFFIIGFALIKINKVMFLISCIFIFFLGIVAVIFGNFYKQRYPLDMESYSNLQSFTTESFTGIETIRTMPASNFFLNEYKKRQSQSMKVSWSIEEKYILQNSFVTIFSRLSSLSVLIVGFYFVMKNLISLGQVAAFFSLSGFFSSSINSLINLQSGIQEAFAAINRLFEILSIESSISNGNEKPENLQPEIKFDKIDFSYIKEKPIYENFDLKISKGEWISFIGETGCGKTTITRLLLKFYKPNKGRILWNNIDLQDIDTNWLYSKIAYIPQDIILFAGTILENLTLFNQSYNKEKIYEITKQVGIYDKIMSLPNQFETLVGEKGTFLSGGEKQKIAIARALIKNPLLIIFDEATSNLDVFSEKQIVQIIKELHQNGMTIITIAHRLSTIKECDNIIILDNGKIVEAGSHKNLMRKNGIYKKMLG